MHGWMGKRLRLDLTNRTYEIEKLPVEHYKKWLGGRGSNFEVLYHETRQGVSPFDPENPLCFASGALSGTFAPLSGRTDIGSRSPMTCSSVETTFCGHVSTYMGGAFGPMMKYAGYDQIIVKGKADRPVYVFVDDDKIEFCDANHLWGLGIRKSAIKILEELGESGIKAALIGPAGENLVRFACIMDTFGASNNRNQMGAVMGSKNLKALAVRGTKPVKIAKPDKFMKECRALLDKIRNTASVIRKKFGDNSKMELAKKFLFRRNSCWSCPVACGRYTYINEGRYAGFHCPGPDIESIFSLCRIGTFDAAGVAVLCDIMNDLGMDNIKAAEVLYWALNAFESGIISEKDTCGIRLESGCVDTSIKILEMIAKREGIGDMLAEGNVLQNDIKQKLCSLPEKNRFIADMLGCCSRAIDSVDDAERWKESYVSLLKFATGIDFSDDEIAGATEMIINIEKDLVAGT